MRKTPEVPLFAQSVPPQLAFVVSVQLRRDPCKNRLLTPMRAQDMAEKPYRRCPGNHDKAQSKAAMLESTT